MCLIIERDIHEVNVRELEIEKTQLHLRGLDMLLRGEYGGSILYSCVKIE
jgi:hypothetical protein